MESTDKAPEMIIIAGPNGSGKTTITTQFLHYEWSEGILYINPDIIAQEKFGDWNSTESVLRAAQYCENLIFSPRHRKTTIQTIRTATVVYNPLKQIPFYTTFL